MENWNTLSKRVATRIEDMIASRPDPRLPSQRELSSLFGVSRTSVREALSLLQASGKLRTEPGRGSFWVGAPAGRQQPENPDMLVNIEAGQELPSKKTHPKSEISRFRYLIEGQSGRLAAMRITDSEIAQLEKNLNTFKKSDRGHGPRGQRPDRFRISSADRRIFGGSACFAICICISAKSSCKPSRCTARNTRGRGNRWPSTRRSSKPLSDGIRTRHSTTPTRILSEAPIAWASRMLAKSFSLFIVAARKKRCPKGAPAILDDHHT